MTERTRSLSRRSFVLALGAATAATATAAAIATRSAAPRPAASGEGKRAKKGYQASAHVGRYYRTTRI
jgi:hypothetical protein